ncbi:MAG: hypothetical protein ONB46_08650 [candidate division KSB1 bacterium]|nr:hypothetical protein [candidate division KSB1 bacterium]MDZ7365908.1 hypothetical protein [candidate division KSB1 bacterium]MDZ7403858.1 hypothetical protein [candidate division KSB1 bacterium]
MKPASGGGVIFHRRLLILRAAKRFHAELCPLIKNIFHEACQEAGRNEAWHFNKGVIQE